MASLEQRSGHFRVVFRFAGRKFNRSLKTANRTEAAASLARLEDNLRRLELGTLVLPDHTDLASFLLSDGRRNGKPRAPEVNILKELLERYLASVPPGCIEDSTRKVLQIHQRHLARILGNSFPIQSLTLGDVQKYVDQRSRGRGLRGRRVSTTTIKKELITFAAAWKWGMASGFLQRPFPKLGLKFPKSIQKPRFQTWAEIERRIARGGLTKEQEADLWDNLFLTLPEIDELLSFVRRQARHPFIFPMFTFAAHTGARRSEILRSLLDDLDFAGNTITIHEKKRVRGKLTTRQVPMSPVLRQVLLDWIEQHAGGQYTFCHSLHVAHRKTNRSEPVPLTPDEAHVHFKRTLADSKWAKLRGWHIFRHSFCSNCAASGIDQRLINGWVGHQTEEMVRRYRHLVPEQQQAAIAAVFGNGTQNAKAPTVT